MCAVKNWNGKSYILQCQDDQIKDETGRAHSMHGSNQVYVQNYQKTLRMMTSEETKTCMGG